MPKYIHGHQAGWNTERRLYSQAAIMQLNWNFQRGMEGGKYGYFLLISVSFLVSLPSSTMTGANHGIF